MSWENDYDEFLNDIVIREAFAGRNGYGEPTFTGGQSIAARVVLKPQVIATGASEITSAVREVLSKATIYLGPEPVWDIKDRITLPDGSKPPILQVVAYPDETSEPSLHHQVVIV